MALTYHTSTFKLGPLQLVVGVSLQVSPWLNKGEHIVAVSNDVTATVHLFKWHKTFLLPPITMHYQPEYKVEILSGEDVYLQVGNQIKPTTKSRRDLDKTLSINIDNPPTTVANVWGSQSSGS